MSQGQILTILTDALMVSLKLAGPMLLVSVLIGLIVAIFQAATQIHEQTLTFVPKLICIAFLLLFTGSWMMTVFAEFVDRIFLIMRSL